MEIWDLVDKNGNRTGKSWPRNLHDEIPDGYYHVAVEVWVRVDDKLLLTQRHPSKTDGLMYDCPGGAVVSGEDFALGAKRELYEEVGISADLEDLVYIGSMIRGCCYAMTYLLVLDELPEIQLQPTEVVGFITVTSSELEDMADRLTGGTYKRYIEYKDRLLGSK